MRNRIQRYERLWTERAEPASGVPQGFTLYPTAQLNAAQQAAVAAQQRLYQWAYDRARAEADQRFANDWTI